jgi:RNA polymerase sigma-70 factor (ECF subfamily)
MLCFMGDAGLSEKTDRDLILSSMAGDHGSFAVLVERYVSPIYKFSYRYVRNGPDAEDVAQETFLRVWKNLKQFDQSKNFKTWLFAIAKNASLDSLKKRKTLSFSSLGEEDDAVEAVLAPYVAVADASDVTFDRSLLRKRFDAALGQLPERYRDVMVMRYTGNLKFREIAERLHEPIDTVKSRHRRGLALLRGMVDDGDLAANG